MGSAVLNDIVAAILAVFLLMVGPIYTTYKEIDNIADTSTRDAVSYFQKEVRKNGYVDAKSYSEFLNLLSRSGRVYKIEMIHTSKLAYPKGDGDFQLCYTEYGTQQILKQVKSSKYTMKYGDEFSVKVSETETAPSRFLVKAFANSSNNTTMLSFKSGGMIENEVYD